MNEYSFLSAIGNTVYLKCCHRITVEEISAPNLSAVQGKIVFDTYLPFGY